MTSSTRKPGRSFEYEPEDVEARSYIGFEADEMPDPYGTERHVAGTIAALRALSDELEAEAPELAEVLGAEVLGLEVGPLEFDEVGLWGRVEVAVTVAGFDVYNSDTRFEVYN